MPLSELAAAISGEKGGLVQLSGGEPFLLEPAKLLGLAAACVKAGKTVELQSNASLIKSFPEKDFRMLVKLVNVSGGYFNLNFPADSPAADLRITGLKGGFSARMAAVRRLLEAGARVRLTHVILRANFKRLPRFASFAVRLGGIDWLQFSFAKGIGKAAANKKVVPSYEEVSPLLVEALRVAEEAGLRADVDHIPPCFLGPYGKLHVDFGKFRRGDKGPYLDEKSRIRLCLRCALRKRCAGARKDYLAIYGGFTPPADWSWK